MKLYITVFLSLIVFVCNSQDLIWTGNATNNDFFDETNWADLNTNLAPSIGTIDAGQAINSNLQLHNASDLVIASGVINLSLGSLSVSASSLQAQAISGGSVTINNGAYVDVSAANPFQNNVTINFTSGIAWIRTLNKKGVDINNDNLAQITVNGSASVYESNLRLDNYYLNGTVIRSNDLTTSPLTIYDDINLQGSNTNLSIDIIFSGSGISNNLDNSTESFILKKGYMVTFSVLEDGTGKSKNYIASEEDLIINELPYYLQNDISFIRVIPWNWVNKKGRTGSDTELNNTWTYQWNNTGNSSLELEYAPMSWGFGGANDDGDITLYKSKYKATHVMAFNEADNCNDQSGQYNNLCQTDVAVSTYKNLMKTGLRLVSPSCRENAPLGWLKEFHDKANAQDIRIDVIAVHWYDWGSNPANSPNANPSVVFNRFKTYLENVHNLYGLPIWITEFNANPNRSNATNYGFMQLALPYLETLDYVERYCWYQPNSGVADYYNASGTVLTNVGTFYKNQVSTTSIPESTVSADSNLDLFYTLDINNFNETTNDNALLFPNPTKGLFTLKASLDLDSYFIYNVQGQLIKSNQNILASPEAEINLSNELDGVYFILVKFNNGNQSMKKLILN
ncbi:glycosyl hydrolase [Yeosuana sp. AK3]